MRIKKISLQTNLFLILYTMYDILFVIYYIGGI